MQMQTMGRGGVGVIAAHGSDVDDGRPHRARTRFLLPGVLEFICALQHLRREFLRRTSGLGLLPTTLAPTPSQALFPTLHGPRSAPGPASPSWPSHPASTPSPTANQDVPAS
jgi:hypothetical protein